jgi:FixJ family two-component response regulator
VVYLSPRERQVVVLVADGQTSKAIAELLGISVKCIEWHRANISRKMGKRGAAALTRLAIRRGLIEA